MPVLRVGNMPRGNKEHRDEDGDEEQIPPFSETKSLRLS